MAKFQVTLHKFWHEGGFVDEYTLVVPLQSFYSYAPPFEPQTHDFNKIATQLVFAERLMNGTDMEFGRVVFLKIDEETPHSSDTRTVTCVPSFGDGDSSDDHVRGLRGGPMLDFAFDASVVRNCELGKQHKRRFFGALGRDDIADNWYFRTEKARAALRPDATFGAAFDFWKYIVHHLEHVDPSREHTRLGVKVQYEPYVSEHLIHVASNNYRIRKLKIGASDSMMEFWRLQYFRDKEICQSLRYYFSVMDNFQGTWGDGYMVDFCQQYDLGLYLVGFWEQYSFFLGYGVPADTWYGRTATRFLYSSYNDVAKVGSLREKYIPGTVFSCVNRLYGIHQWFSRDNLGYLFSDAWAKSETPFYRDTWPDFTHFKFLFYQRYGHFHHEPYTFNYPVWRDWYELYPIVVSAFFERINQCNVLDQVMTLAPNPAVPRVGMPTAKTVFYAKNTAASTAASYFEFVPYVAIQAYERPRYADPPPPSRMPEVAVRIPNPKVVPKRSDGLPIWWKGNTPAKKPDYEGALRALGKDVDKLYGGIDEAARNANETLENNTGISLTGDSFIDIPQ
jgi:hypothetical protein